MTGAPKSVRAIRLAAWHCTHPEIDGVDKALLAYLAEYAGPDGSGAHPGNRNIADALRRKDSATDARLAKNIALGLIERTERANGRNRASAYRLRLASPYYPDETVGGEKLVKRVHSGEPTTAKPPGQDCAVCEQPAASEPPGISRAVSGNGTAHSQSGNRPVNELKPPGQDSETARPRPTTNKSTSNTHQPPTYNSDNGGGLDLGDFKKRWAGFFVLLPHEMQTAIIGKTQAAELEKQLVEFGPERLASAIQNWVRNRDLPVGTLLAKWHAWFVEGPEHLKLKSVEETLEAKNKSRAVDYLLKYYVAALKRDPAIYLLTPQRDRMLRARLEETVRLKGTLEAATNFMARCVDTMTESDWHMGRNPKTQGRTYNELENCFARDKFQQWVTAVDRRKAGDRDYDQDADD